MSFFQRAVLVAVVSLAVGACGGGGDDLDVEGTYVHPEEGTIVLEAGGDGTLTQEGDENAFEWDLDGDTVVLTVGGDVVAEAAFADDELTFRPGDFSGDEPAVFVRS